MIFGPGQFKVANLLGKSRMIFICNVQVDVCVNTAVCNVYIQEVKNLQILDQFQYLQTQTQFPVQLILEESLMFYFRIFPKTNSEFCKLAIFCFLITH